MASPIGNAFFAGFLASLATIVSSFSLQFISKNYIYWVKNLPLNILVLGYAIFQNKLDNDDATKAFYAMTFSLLTNYVFILSWKYIPRSFPPNSDMNSKLGATMGLSILIWAVSVSVLFGVLFGITQIINLRPLGITVCCISILYFCYDVHKQANSPSASEDRKKTTNAVRNASKVLGYVAIVTEGIMEGFLVFAACLLIRSGNLGILGGLFLTFPCPFISAMVTLWLKSGDLHAVKLFYEGSNIPAQTIVNNIFILVAIESYLGGISSGNALGIAFALSFVVGTAPTSYLLTQKDSPYRGYERQKEDKSLEVETADLTGPPVVN